MSINTTPGQFDQVANICKEIFIAKMSDYGTAWRIMRPCSITDQILIKAQRIRTIQIEGTSKVDEDARSEFIGIVNYSIIGLIQLQTGFVTKPDMNPSEALELYDKFMLEAKQLMMNKNHDYGEAWRVMRVSSLTDLILMKILRVKQIENNQGITLISEGIPANYLDMVNYAIFSLIKMEFAINEV